MHYSRKNQPAKHLEPELFGAAFLQLDQVIERFHPLLEDDPLLQERLETICGELKARAIERKPVEHDKSVRVIKRLEQASNHAMDVAKEDEDASTFFALANELRLCSIQFQRNLTSAT
ncbi:MAG: hypothetical protein CMK89_18950 [Pseudomonadales bacterium]|nr:hypothetical protein [Pseudomonadales bacterium]